MITPERIVAGGQPAATWVISMMPPPTPAQVAAFDLVVDAKIQSDMKTAFSAAGVNILAEPGRTLYTTVLRIVCPGCVTN